MANADLDRLIALVIKEPKQDDKIDPTEKALKDPLVEAWKWLAQTGLDQKLVGV